MKGDYFVYGLGRGAVDLGAAVLYAPTPIGSSPRTSDYGDVSQSGFRTFDNFSVNSNGYVETVSWRGFSLGNAEQPAAAPAPDANSWEIAFYGDNAGIPGTQLRSSRSPPPA